jgi:hypothetical protein
VNCGEEVGDDVLYMRSPVVGDDVAICSNDDPELDWRVKRVKGGVHSGPKMIHCRSIARCTMCDRDFVSQKLKIL